MTESQHRLEGLEPDNLLALLALVGLMRALDASGELGAVRIAWSVDDPPVRPVLHLPDPADRAAVLGATAGGIRQLTEAHEFDRRGLTFTSDEGRERLLQARDSFPELWAALLSDAAVSRDGMTLRATPLCLQLGAGHQHFLTRLADVPTLAEPPSRRAAVPAGGQGFRRNAASQRRSFGAGAARTPHSPSGGTTRRTCATRCAPPIRRTRRPAQRPSTAPTGSPPWACPCSSLLPRGARTDACGSRSAAEAWMRRGAAPSPSSECRPLWKRSTPCAPVRNSTPG